LHEALKPLRIDNGVIEWNSKRYKYSININHEVIELLQQLYSDAGSVDNAELLLKSLRITNIRIDINRDNTGITTENTNNITNKHELKYILTDAYYLLKYIESSVSNYIKIKELLKYIVFVVNGSDSNYRPISCIRDKGIPIIEQYDTNKKQWIVYIFVKDSKDVDIIVDCLFR
jgi:CRISPR/Cas system-associated endonuclease Cas3-HD